MDEEENRRGVGVREKGGEGNEQRKMKKTECIFDCMGVKYNVNLGYESRELSRRKRKKEMRKKSFSASYYNKYSI